MGCGTGQQKSTGRVMWTDIGGCLSSFRAESHLVGTELAERGPAGKAQLLDQGIEYVQPELVRLRVFTKPINIMQYYPNQTYKLLLYQHLV